MTGSRRLTGSSCSADYLTVPRLEFVDHKPMSRMPPTRSLLLVALVALMALNAAAAGATTRSSRLPKLGSEVFAGRAGVGWGTYKPNEIFNGGDPTGQIEDIDWSSWGGPTAIGYGTGLYVGPHSDVADGRPGRAELRAFD